jgi:hypothetical protein
MDVRYEGGLHGVTGASEPDLILTDSQALIDSGQTGQNESVAYMGLLSVLVQWHFEDPVGADEQWRNDVVFAFQGNRNPFVDHPEWVDCLFNGNCEIGTRYCDPSVTNSSGNSAFIDAAGSIAVADNNFLLVCSAMPANQFGYFLTSQTQGFVTGPGGSQGDLCLGGQIARFSSQVQNSGPFGSIGITVDLTSVPTSPPVSILSGETWNFSTWFRDNNPGPTSNFSDGLQITFL